MIGVWAYRWVQGVPHSESPAGLMFEADPTMEAMALMQRGCDPGRRSLRAQYRIAHDDVMYQMEAPVPT